MRSFSLVAAAFTTAAVVLLSSTASADLVIKSPHKHPDYRAELEPHGVFRIWHRKFGRFGGSSRRALGNAEFGLGFRATIELADPAFVPKINNTVGITFGTDITSCNGYCPNPELISYFPVGLQWNFFLSDDWSVMFEPGFVLVSYSLFEEFDADFMVFAGGRYHFNDDIALTMRVGYPFTFSIGPSFFVGR